MASSTSPVHNGWSLEEIPGDELALLLKVPRKEAAALRTRLLAQHADPAWVAATLDALPAATIALLSLVIDAGGLLMDDQLLRAARERFGMSVDDCRIAAAPAISRVLVVPLSMRNDGLALGAVQPAASLIAPLLADLDLVELPGAGLVATASPAQNARTFLATCVATRHLDVKLTIEGRPHRATIKRLARQVGLDEDSLEAMVRTGLEVGVLQLEGELVRPDPEALAEAAAGRYPRCPPLAALCAQLPSGPVASAALFRSLQRRRDPSHPRLPGPEALGFLPGFEVGTVGDVAAVVRRVPEGTASGHVTPSFEVFLPPESRLLDIVHVGACCEWERLDRAFVGRITKASITRTAVAGAGADPILAGLAAASRHPIPQNVEAAIRDWASSVIAATITTGHVIVVDPGVHARVAGALAGCGARAPAPGVFVVDGLVEVRGITGALARAGVYHRELAPPPAPPKPAFDPAPPGPRAVRLRDRVAAWRRGEPFEGVRDDYLDTHRIVPRVRPAATAATAPAATTPDAMLARWALARQVRLDDDNAGHQGIAAILAMLSAAEVAKLLDGSQDVDQLLRALARVVVKRGWARPPQARASRAPAAAGKASVALRWQHDDLRERLQAAARRSESLAVQLAGGVRYLEITQTIRRGSTWMVLGEDLRHDEAVALRLDDVQAIAVLPDDFGVDDDGIGLLPAEDDEDDEEDEPDRGGQRRRPWRPAPGQAPPPGHLPCPCGSGVRYRRCCRDVPAA